MSIINPILWLAIYVKISNVNLMMGARCSADGLVSRGVISVAYERFPPKIDQVGKQPHASLTASGRKQIGLLGDCSQRTR